MKKLFFLINLITPFILIVNGQNYVDVLRYSEVFPHGTARFCAMGGAFGALGGDFSSIVSNPAGVAVFTKNEFSVSLSLLDNNIRSEYYESVNHNQTSSSNITNLGVVFSDIQGRSQKGRKNKKKNTLPRIAFSLGYRTTNIYDNRQLITAFNNNSTMADVFLSDAQANGGQDYNDLNPFSTQLAYYTDLIDTVDNTYTYETRVDSAGEYQNNIKYTSGSSGEFVFNLGAKLKSNLYIGGSIGIPFVDYYESIEHLENQFTTPSVTVNSFEYNTFLNTTGGGLNIKVGLIYRPLKWFRLGLAIHSPTWYTLIDTYDASMHVEFIDGSSFGEQFSPLGLYEYDLSTPARMITSAGFIFGNKGLISLDSEIIDYTLAHLNSGKYDYIDENQIIEDTLSLAYNLRLGTEWRLGPFSLRGGLGYFTSPFGKNINDGSITYSMGCGYKHPKFSIDISYLTRFSEEHYYLYTHEVSSLEKTNNSFTLTFGYVF